MRAWETNHPNLDAIQMPSLRTEGLGSVERAVGQISSINIQ